jgi:PST family polysaccharide transporter
MNGFSKYRMMLMINIIGQILGLMVTLILIWQNNLDGALISVVVSPSLIFLITFVGISNQRSLAGLIEANNISYSYIKKLSAYSVMALITAIAFPIVMIKIRNYIGSNVGLQEAGFWEGMNRISSYYLMFFNSLMTLYILPRFSEIDSVKEFRKEVFDFYKTIVPIFAFGLLLVYFLRNLIITIVFTPEFGPMQELFFWQLLGDFVKVLSVVIAYQFIAKRMFWHFVISEVFSVIITYATSIYFIDLYGVKGATIAHFVSYSMYYGIILMIFGTKLFGTLPTEELEISEEDEDEQSNN